MFIKYENGLVVNCNNFDICVVDAIFDTDEKNIMGYGVFFVRRNGSSTDAVCVSEYILEDISETSDVILKELREKACDRCEEIVNNWLSGEPCMYIYEDLPVDEPLFALY